MVLCVESEHSHIGVLGCNKDNFKGVCPKFACREKYRSGALLQTYSTFVCKNSQYVMKV